MYVQAGAGVPPFWRDEGARLKHGREQRQALRRPSRLNEKGAERCMQWLNRLRAGDAMKYD